MKLTQKQIKLAKLVTQGKGRVTVITGSATRPIKTDFGSVFVGANFWWGHLVPMGRNYSGVISDWEAGIGQWYSSDQNAVIPAEIID